METHTHLSLKLFIAISSVNAETGYCLRSNMYVFGYRNVKSIILILYRKNVCIVILWLN